MVQKQAPRKVFAFIDSQNLNSGIIAAGWKLDHRKFRNYLRDQYGVDRAFLFIGFMPTHEDLYKQLEASGFELIFKQTHELPDETVKGNVDAELVLYTMIYYPLYDKAIIVSGDGDFFSLIEYLQKQNKLLKVLTPNRFFSGLLHEFEPYIVRLDQLRRQLEYRVIRKKKPSDSNNEPQQGIVKT